MNIQINKYPEHHKWHVTLKGHIDFDCRLQFKEVIHAFLHENLKKLTLDFEFVESINTNFVGMLLLLREEAKESMVIIEIINLSGQAKSMLECAGLNDLFVIR